MAGTKERISFSANVRKIDNRYLVSINHSAQTDGNLEQYAGTKTAAKTVVDDELTKFKAELA